MISTLHDQILRFAEEMLAEGKTQDEANALAAEVLEKAIPELFASTIKELDETQVSMVKLAQKDQSAFERRNLRRWRKSFALADTVVMLTHEIGENFNRHHRPEAAKETDLVFEAVIRLHSRALLIAREALHLCKGGYADGALSRWRSLHECKVIATFIASNGNEAAIRYFASFECASLKAAKELNTVVGLPGYDLGFNDQEIEAMERRVKDICDELGPEMRHDYGWAGKVLNKAKPTFANIEESVGLAHERPRYRWASQHTHATSRPPNKLLGASESTELMYLVGASNSGMTDPLQFVALGLADMTKLLLEVRPTLDGQVWGAVIDHYAGHVGKTALEEERLSLKRAQARRARKGSPDED
jgi:hypothetical protein